MRKFTGIAALCCMFLLAGVPQANAQVAVTPHVGLVMPFGDFADIAGFGFGGGADLCYQFNDNVAGIASVDYHKFGEEIDGFSGSFIPVLAGIKYSFAGNGKMMPYVSGQVGMYMAGGDFEGEEFGFAPGFGVSVPMDEMMLDIGGKFNYVNTENDASYYIGLNVGLSFMMK